MSKRTYQACNAGAKCRLQTVEQTNLFARQNGARISRNLQKGYTSIKNIPTPEQTLRRNVHGLESEFIKQATASHSSNDSNKNDATSGYPKRQDLSKPTIAFVSPGAVSANVVSQPG